MTKIHEKYHKWYSKVMEGGSASQDFSTISHNEAGEWGIIEGRTWERISSITVLVTRNNSTEVFYQWDKESKTNNVRDFIIMIKDGRKMIINDRKEGIISFGFKDKEDNVEKMLILLSNDEANMFVGASKDAECIDVCYNVLQAKTNPFQSCWNSFIHTVMNNKIESEGDEVVPTENDLNF